MIIQIVLKNDGFLSYIYNLIAITLMFLLQNRFLNVNFNTRIIYSVRHFELNEIRVAKVLLAKQDITSRYLIDIIQKLSNMFERASQYAVGFVLSIAAR